MSEKENTSNYFIFILLVGVIISIIVSFYMFFYKKNYDFLVETRCDTGTEKCFYRDCKNNLDLCPPNGLSYYGKYTIKAKDFKFCQNEDCTEACKNGSIKCLKTECSKDNTDGDICTEPIDTNTDILNTEN